MSFWNGVKHAFGFTPDDEEEEEYLSADIPSTPAQTAAATPTPSSPETQGKTAGENMTPEGADTAAETGGDPTLPADLFDAVLEVFNSAQPDFIRRCISTDAQREYLLNSLSGRLRSRLSRAVGTEAIAADEELRAECKRLSLKISSLEKEAKIAEALKRENSRLRLSIENQKRALQDRITDLETQIEKAASKKGSKPQQPVEEKDPAADSTELTMLTRELQRQTTMREQAEMKSRMADQMISELRNIAAAARRELDENLAEQEEAAAYLQDKMTEFEALKKRLEGRIDILTRQIEEHHEADYEGRITRLNEENASLRHTIENNLYNQANSEMRLRKEIKELRQRLGESALEATEPTATYSATEKMDKSKTDQPPAKPRRGRPRKVRIDTELGNTDVFDTGSQKAPVKDDPDFGYHEPPRHPGNDNEAQLTLFD
ncbi:MAG: hypothetical protein NC039_02395 [Muribaculaceae bacterium]|nr:hypothetical protein [Muribaculaceae bacterium]